MPLARVPNRSPSILFSLLKPGAHIPPHNGLVNTRLICHLPLIVPGPCHVPRRQRAARLGERPAPGCSTTRSSTRPGTQRPDARHTAVRRVAAGAARRRARARGRRCSKRSTRTAAAEAGLGNLDESIAAGFMGAGGRIACGDAVAAETLPGSLRACMSERRREPPACVLRSRKRAPGERQRAGGAPAAAAHLPAIGADSGARNSRTRRRGDDCAARGGGWRRSPKDKFGYRGNMARADHDQQQATGAAVR